MLSMVPPPDTFSLVLFSSTARQLGSNEEYVRFVGTADYVSPEMLNDEDTTEASDLWALGCVLFQMLSGAPPFRADSDYLTFKRIEELDYSFPGAFHVDAQALVRALLQPEPARRLGAGRSAGGYPELKLHAFFVKSEPPVDFNLIHTLPPPPLLLSPHMPDISRDLARNGDLAERLLPSEYRGSLMAEQAGIPYSNLLSSEKRELIVLATTVFKYRHLSCKRRHLVLSDAMDGTCRLFYLDSVSWALKGTIPWSKDLHAVLMPRGSFRIHTPKRTYYLSDPGGSDVVAECWVRTITKMQARHVLQRQPLYMHVHSIS